MPGKNLNFDDQNLQNIRKLNWITLGTEYIFRKVGASWECWIGCMLDVRWLQDLIVIAETRNFTRASQIRHVTQSGLSRRIQSLEHWVGSPIIDRSQSPLSLTEAGHILLEAAQNVLAQLNNARRTVRENRDATLRSISFAAPHILSVTFFPEWLQHVQTMLGPTRLSITSDNLPGCCTALDDGRADLVICLVDADGGVLAGASRRLSIDDKASIVVGRERLIPLSAPGPDGKPLHDLRAPPHVSVSYLEYSRECSLGWAVDRKLAGRAGLPHLTNLYENSLADGLRGMALSGLGLAWLPLTVTHNDILRGRLVRTGGEDLIIDLDVRVYRPTRELGHKAEELWAKLSAGSGGEYNLPDLSADLHSLRQGVGD